LIDQTLNPKKTQWDLFPNGKFRLKNRIKRETTKAIKAFEEELFEIVKIMKRANTLFFMVCSKGKTEEKQSQASSKSLTKQS